MFSTLLNIVHSRSEETHETYATGDCEVDPREQLCHAVGKACRDEAQKFDTVTKLENPDLPTVSDSWITVGKLIGTGGFNSVHEVIIKDPNSDEDDACAYACKHLRRGIMKRKTEFHGAAVDLVVEAKLLNSLNHKNIVGLYATSCGTLEKAYLNGSSYCLFLDRLYGTVEEKFDEWRSHGEGHFKRRNLRLRLQQIALPIAEAMEYLHKQRILFRDIKPANMGYTKNETTVKLFDFGLAKELTHTTRLTGCTGSRRYMAPEVALSTNYSYPADVYSFGIFLHECCSLQKPFDQMSRVEHTEYVAKGKLRPKLSAAGGPTALQKLISKCWQRSPRGRPTFSQIIQVLRQVTNSDQEGNTFPKTSVFYGIFRRNGKECETILKGPAKNGTAALAA